MLKVYTNKLQQAMNFLLKIIFLLRIVKVNSIWLIIRHWYRKKIKRKISPAAVMIALTYRCQLRCKHCAVADYRDDNELSFATIRTILDQLFSLRIPRVYFDGGEALLREDINEIIEYCSKKGFITFLETNGYGLSRKTIRNLKKAGISSVNVSLHSSNEETHDRFTGVKGSFKKTLDAISLCSEGGLPCLISIVATKDSIKKNEIRKMISLVKHRTMTAVRLTAPHFIGRWKDIYELLNEEEVKYIRIIFSVGIPIFKRVELRKCIIGYTLYINPSGELLPCEFIPYSFGNVTKKPVKDILELMLSHKMFNERVTSCRIDDPIFRNTYINSIKTEPLPVKLY